jgi:hypothetical protein
MEEKSMQNYFSDQLTDTHSQKISKHVLNFKTILAKLLPYANNRIIKLTSYKPGMLIEIIENKLSYCLGSG